ncbi:hypothetical protein ACFQ6Q_22915 [Streptomyces sp. NPDC056437]
MTKRRKTLGAYVPFWGPGPCRNPDCAQSAESGGERPGDPPGRAVDTA